MFNNPSMQAAYHARYSMVRDVRFDFIRVDKVRQWMQEFSAVPACLDFLEKYLRQLCLCSFRKDVFSHIKSLIHKDHVEAALAGRVPLCWPSVDRVLKEKHRPPQLATGNRLAVKNINVLFAWLWEWKDGRFERTGWSEKPYRMLYQRSFDTVALIRGKQQARAWKKSLKVSFYRSHWLLPYPQSRSFMRKSKDSGQVVWWSSFHRGLDRYYQAVASHGALPNPLPASNIKHHPAEFWGLANKDSEYMPYEVQPEQRLLGLSEADLYQQLLDMTEKFNSGIENASGASTKGLAIYDIQDLIERIDWIDRPFKSWDMSKCYIEMNKELEKYEVLQHHGQNLRRRRGGCKQDIESDSDMDSEANNHSEMTSDDESLEQQKKRQVNVIRRIERRMVMLPENQQAGCSGHAHNNWMLKQYTARLRKLPTSSN